MANAVCAAMDTLEFKEIVGTIAGDDTIFIACSSESEAQALTYELKKYISKK
jgi:transcriptional regulator of arginine metabolism